MRGAWWGFAVALATATSATAAPVVTYRSTLDGPAAGLPVACGDERSPSVPQLAVDGTRLTAAFFEDGGEAIVVARSGDAGHRWHREAVAPAYTCTGGPARRGRGYNPTLALAADGVPLVGSSWVGQDGGNFAYGVAVHRGDPAGWTTAEPEPGSAQDIAMTAGDSDVVHAVWNHYDQIPNPFDYAPPRSDMRYARSTDGGRTFGRPAAIVQGLPGFALDTPRIARNPDGSLVAVIGSVPLARLANVVLGEPAEFEILVTRSEDGGATWTAPVTIGRTSFRMVRDRECASLDPGDSSCAVPSLNLDLAAGEDGSVAVIGAPPPPDPASVTTGEHAVQVIRSADGGRTWAPPRYVGRESGRIALPAGAIGRSGRLAVLYYTDTDDEGGDEAWTWTAKVLVQRGAGWTFDEVELDRFDLRPVPSFANDGGETGVYQDIQAMPGSFGVVYTVGAPLAADGISDVRFARVAG